MRAARWSRVSSAKQATSDREGLPYQKELQSEAIALLKADDTQLHWAVTHSGGSVHTTPEWTEMLARAGRDFDVLVVPYTSRLSRRAEEALRAVRLIEASGASVYFAEERVHSADEQQWESFAREAVEAEAYRRRLSRTMKRTYNSRWSRRGLPAGVPPYGFNADWTHHPIHAPVVRAVFTTYAENRISLTRLAAEHGLAEEHVKVMVRNPAYAGRAQYNGQLRPASFEPIVDPAIWDTVAAIRAQRRFTSGGRRPSRPSIIRGRLYCSCGARIRLDGLDGRKQHRVRHLRPCTAWGPGERKPTAYFEEPLKAALRQIRPTEEHLADLLKRLRTEVPPVSKPDTTLLRSSAANQYARGRLSLDAFTAEIARLDAQDAAERTPEHHEMTMDDLRWYYDRFTDPTSDTPDADGWVETGPDAWAHLASRVFARIEHQADNHLVYEPTDEALRHFVIDNMPERVTVGGEGLEPPTSSV